MTPERAWRLASDLQRFEQWMTIFGGWRGPVPSRVGTGTCVSSLIKVKGFRNIIHWCVTGYDEPHAIELTGTGRRASDRHHHERWWPITPGPASICWRICPAGC